MNRFLEGLSENLEQIKCIAPMNNLIFATGLLFGGSSLKNEGEEIERSRGIEGLDKSWLVILGRKNHFPKFVSLWSLTVATIQGVASTSPAPIWINYKGSWQRFAWECPIPQNRILAAPLDRELIMQSRIRKIKRKRVKIIFSWTVQHAPQFLKDLQAEASIANLDIEYSHNI